MKITITSDEAEEMLCEAVARKIGAGKWRCETSYNLTGELRFEQVRTVPEPPPFIPSEPEELDPIFVVPADKEVLF